MNRFPELIRSFVECGWSGRLSVHWSYLRQHRFEFAKIVVAVESIVSLAVTSVIRLREVWEYFEQAACGWWFVGRKGEGDGGRG